MVVLFLILVSDKVFYLMPGLKRMVTVTCCIGVQNLPVGIVLLPFAFLQKFCSVDIYTTIEGCEC